MVVLGLYETCVTVIHVKVTMFVSLPFLIMCVHFLKILPQNLQNIIASSQLLIFVVPFSISDITGVESGEVCHCVQFIQ